MRKLLIGTILLLISSVSVFGQNAPKAELSGGFSYLHVGSSDLYGWDASLAGNLNNWFGVIGEFSGHYEPTQRFSALVSVPGGPSSTLTTNFDSNVYTFLFGPRISFRRNPRLTPFVHVLPGFAREHFSAATTFEGASTTNSDSTTAFAMAAGGGLDVRLTEKLAFRVVQADYILTRFGGTNQSNARLTTGLVFRFGK
jgi:opacity protein-like surface antigen